MRPDAATLAAWQRRWSAIRAAAYRDLVASYTPEQRAIIARMTEAARNEKLAKQRQRAADQHLCIRFGGLYHALMALAPPGVGVILGPVAQAPIFAAECEQFHYPLQLRARPRSWRPGSLFHEFCKLVEFCKISYLTCIANCNTMCV